MEVLEDIAELQRPVEEYLFLDENFREGRDKPVHDFAFNILQHKVIKAILLEEIIAFHYAGMIQALQYEFFTVERNDSL